MHIWDVGSVRHIPPALLGAANVEKFLYVHFSGVCRVDFSGGRVGRTGGRGGR